MKRYIYDGKDVKLNFKFFKIFFDTYLKIHYEKEKDNNIQIYLLNHKICILEYLKDIFYNNNISINDKFIFCDKIYEYTKNKLRSNDKFIIELDKIFKDYKLPF
jgi:hypothetical protein